MDEKKTILEKENDPSRNSGVRKLSSRRPNSAYASTMQNIYGGENKEGKNVTTRSKASQRAANAQKRTERARRDNAQRPKSALARSSGKSKAKVQDVEQSSTLNDAIASRVKSEIDLVRVYAGEREAEEMEARWKAGENIIPTSRRPKSAYVATGRTREVLAAPLEDAILADHAHGKGPARSRKARPKSAVPTGTRRQSRSRSRPRSSRPRSRSRQRWVLLTPDSPI